VETIYAHGFSPADTEWATSITTDEVIAATNWETLEATNSFTNWIDAFGGPVSQGAGIENTPAVVHLITDDIYLDLMFTDWGGGQWGGYTYVRAESPTTMIPTGDYNLNGQVDAADYVVWRKTLNSPAVPQGSGADGNSSGTIDAGDYTYWAERFGNVVPPGGGAGSAAVPEPAAATWALFAALTGQLFARRRAG
jgi:uncharacterized protein (TIGR03382 family)